MDIKSILEQIAAESSTNKKLAILKSHSDNELLQKVLYAAYSRRVKYYIKQVPNECRGSGAGIRTLEQCIADLSYISSREYTGFKAIEYLVYLAKDMYESDVWVLKRIIGKDLKIGMARTSINKVFPGLIEETPYMGAQSFSKKKVAKLFEDAKRTLTTVCSQEKMDGRYCNVIVRSGQVEMESRQGEDSHVGDALFVRELSTFKDCVLNGELTIDGVDRYTSNGIISSIIDMENKRTSQGELDAVKLKKFEQKHGNLSHILDRIRFTVWDCLTIEEYFEQHATMPYASRLERVKRRLRTSLYRNISIVNSIPVENYQQALQHFVSIVDKGGEGTILKLMSGEWANGKPAYQLKMKLEMMLDLKIVGFEYGSVGSKNEHVITTLNLESSCGMLKTNPAGMDEEMMQYVTDNMEELLGKIVEIKCYGLTPANEQGVVSTLHPSIVEFREKLDCDSLQSAIEIENMAKSLN